MSLLPDLRALLGEAHVFGPEDQIDRYAVDVLLEVRGRPAAVVRPADTAEVAAVMRYCHAAGIPVVPQGGNTGLVRGGVPSDDGREVVVSLERLNRVRALDPLDFSMTLETGCVLQRVHEIAEEADRFFPLSLGARGSCQIGGNIGTNAGGVNVLRWGMMRDLVLGLEVVLPDGRVWNGLRALRKNNMGYDLKQLFIGAEGTLGIVTAATVKLFPRPTQIETCLLALPSTEAAMALYAAARRDLADLMSAFELIMRPCIEIVLANFPDIREPITPPSPVYVLLEASASGLLELRPLLEAFLQQVMENGMVQDGILAESRAQAAQLWRLREDLVEAHYIEAPVYMRSDVSTRLSDLPGFIAETERAIAARMPGMRPIVFGHIGDGNTHFNVLPPRDTPESEAYALSKRATEIVYEVVERFGGSISAEHGIGRVKRDKFLKMLSPVEHDLMLRVKAAIDPDGVMVPGRVL